MLVGGAHLGTREKTSGRASLATLAIGAIGLAIAAWLRPSPALATPLIDAALIAVGVAIGGAIGGRIEHPGHLLPAALVAAAADVISVLSPEGPTHAIVEDERALSLMAISFPIPGTRLAAPALGVGDLVFTALLLSAARAHALPRARAAVLALLGLAAAGGLSAALERAVPALPLIGLTVVAGLPAARRVRAKDRTVTWIAGGVSLLLAAGALVRHVAAARH